MLSELKTKVKTRGIAECLRSYPEYLELYTFLVTNGWDLDTIFSWINDQLEWGEYQPPVTHSETQQAEIGTGCPKKIRSCLLYYRNLV